MFWPIKYLPYEACVCYELNRRARALTLLQNELGNWISNTQCELFICIAMTWHLLCVNLHSSCILALFFHSFFFALHFAIATILYNSVRFFFFSSLFFFVLFSLYFTWSVSKVVFRDTIVLLTVSLFACQQCFVFLYGRMNELQLLSVRIRGDRQQQKSPIKIDEQCDKVPSFQLNSIQQRSIKMFLFHLLTFIVRQR